MQPIGNEAAGREGSQPQISQEAFAFETRFVVLNYLGQVQPRFSLDGSSSGSEKQRLTTQSSSSIGSSHKRPASVSPRPPSVSPRPPEHSGSGDLKLSRSASYDAKFKALQAKVQKGRSSESRVKQDEETPQREPSGEEQITLSAEIVGDPMKDLDDAGRKKISDHWDRRSKQAKVLRQLKNIAQSRIDEIRATYDSIGDANFEKESKLETEDREVKTQKDLLLPRDLSGVEELSDLSTGFDGNLTGSGSSRFLPDHTASEGVFEAESPGRTAEHDFSPHSENLPESVSPTRPQSLDGLHKASDLLENSERNGTFDSAKLLRPERYSDKTDDSPQRRDKTPRPPPDKSPRRDISADNDASQQSRRIETSIRRDSSSRKAFRPISKESEFSDIDSPSSETSDLASSGRSFVSSAASQRSSVVNMPESEVKALVKTSVLPQVALPLQVELNEQWQQWEKEYEKASQSDSTQGLSPLVSSGSPGSPESEVARKLAVIGDRIQEEMGELLDKAFNDIIALPREQVTYEVLNRVVEEDRLLENTSGWTQVAVLLAFSQRLTLGLLQKGERGLGQLIDYSVRLVEDRAADFILRQGGWSAISELDVSPESSPTEDYPSYSGGASGVQGSNGLLIEPVGINVVGSLLPSPTDNPSDASGAQGASGDHSQNGVVRGGAAGGTKADLNATSDGDAAASLTTDILRSDGPTAQNGASDGGGIHDAHAGDVTPDLVRSSSRNSGGRNIVDSVRSEIRLMRNFSEDLSREAEEARAHRLVTRLTWGSIAAVVIAVGLTLLWKWKPHNSAT